MLWQHCAHMSVIGTIEYPGYRLLGAGDNLKNFIQLLLLPSKLLIQLLDFLLQGMEGDLSSHSIASTLEFLPPLANIILSNAIVIVCNSN